MKEIFCSKCVKVTPHKGELDQNGEFIFHCQTKGCGIFIKFPHEKGMTVEDFDALVQAHEEVNTSSAEARHAHDEANALLTEILSDGTTVSVSSQEEE